LPFDQSYRWQEAKAAEVIGLRQFIETAVLAVLRCWEASFEAIQPFARNFDREGDDFRSLSLQFSSEPKRYAPRPRLSDATDRVLIASGALKEPMSPWGGKRDLWHDLGSGEPPSHFVLAGSIERELKGLKAIADQAGYECSRQEDLPRGAQA